MSLVIWCQLKENIKELGFTEDQINKFRLLGANCHPANKLNKLNLKNLHICHSCVCVCGKKGIEDNFYVGLDRNHYVILGSKCYKWFPGMVDFRSEYRDIK